MIRFEVASCCSAKLLVGFDDNNADFNNNKFGSKAPTNRVTVFKWVKEQIKEAKMEGEAILMINTRSTQVMINEVLFLLGASHTPWMKKTKHLDTELRVWWFPIHEYETPAGSLELLQEQQAEDLKAFLEDCEERSPGEDHEDEVANEDHHQQHLAAENMGKE